MFSKNALVTNVEGILPAETLFAMVEKEYSLGRIELWNFVKTCPGLSSEEKKTLLLLFFITKNKNDDSGQLDEKVLGIWEEIDRRLNLSSRKKKPLCQLVKELPEVWKAPYKKLMRRNAKATDEAGYMVEGCVQKFKTRNNGFNRINVYRLDQSFTYLKVTSNLCKNTGEILTLIMDTAAAVSVIKADVIDPKLVVYVRPKAELIGIVQNGLLESLGTCKIPLFHGNKRFTVEFHLISVDNNIPLDGVLGRNFFEDHLVNIDYPKQEILLKGRGLKIPFYNQFSTFTDRCLLKGHSERVVEAVVKNSNMSKGYVPQFEIVRGIFINRDVKKVDKTSIITVTIRNITSLDQVVEPFCVELLPIPKFVEKDWPIMEAEKKEPAYKKIEAKFKDFQKCLERKDEFPEMPVQEFSWKIHTPNALLCPMDIHKTTFYSKIVNKVYRAHPIKAAGLHKVAKMVSETMTTYLCTDRYLFIEEPSAKDTFFTLWNLKEKLVSEKFSGAFYILELNDVRGEASTTKLFNMIHYIFDETDIEPLVVIKRRRTPKCDDEKFKVMSRNHIGRNSTHYRYVRTYNKLRDGYVWSSMNEDLVDFMMKCPNCKYDMTQFNTLEKVLPPVKATKKKDKHDQAK